MQVNITLRSGVLLEWESSHSFPYKEQEVRSIGGRKQPAEEVGHITCFQEPLPGLFVSSLFLVPKKTGELRPVIDLSTLNQHLMVPHFEMETAQTVKMAIQSREWAACIDIKDAFLHIPMCPAVRHFLHFCVNKCTYQFMCLPMRKTAHFKSGVGFWLDKSPPKHS